MQLKSAISLFAIVFALQIAVVAQTTEVLIKQAQAAIEKQDYPSALQAIEAVLKTEPKNDAALAEKARVLFFQKKNVEALAEIEKAISANPNNFVALNLRGLLKEQNKDLAGAVADYGLAIAANPSFVKAYLNRVKVNMTLKAERKEILKDLAKAIELEPNSIQVSRETVRFCLAFTDNAGCQAEMDKFIKLNPLPEAYYARGLWTLLQKLENSSYGDKVQIANEALADFSKAAENNGLQKYPELYRNLGRTQFFANKYTESLANLNKQVELETSKGKLSPWSFIQRSETNLALGDTEAALKDYAELEKINPKIPLIYMGRGEIFLKKNDYDNALTAFKKAVEIYPSKYNYSKIAFLYVKKNDLANAETNWKLTTNNYPKNGWIFKSDSAPYCENTTVWAEISLSKGNKDRAIDQFFQASDGRYETDAACMIAAANKAGELSLERYPVNAIKAYERVLELNPSDSNAQAKLSQAKENDRRQMQAASNSVASGSGGNAKTTPNGNRRPCESKPGACEELDRKMQAKERIARAGLAIAEHNLSYNKFGNAYKNSFLEGYTKQQEKDLLLKMIEEKKAVKTIAQQTIANYSKYFTQDQKQEFQAYIEKANADIAGIENLLKDY